jgi:hypothetical protein
MAEEGDDEASSSDSDADVYGHGWKGATEFSNDEEEEDCDSVTSCCASGNAVRFCMNIRLHCGCDSQAT